MMSLLHMPRVRKVMGDLRQHAPRTILVIAAIVVGLAGAGTVLDTWALVRIATREEFKASRPPSATLRVDSLGSFAAGRLRELTSIAAIQARRVATGTVRVGNDPTPKTLVVFALDNFADTDIGVLQREVGTWPPKDGSLVLERSSVDFAGASLGDKVTIQIGNEVPLTLPMEGVARDVSLAPGWMEHVVYAFATPSTLARLGAPRWLNEIRIRVRDSTADRSAIRRVANAASAFIQTRGGAVTNIDVPVPGAHIHAAQINSLLLTQGAFGVVALLLSGILVVNLITAMLTGETREIGVMRAIGATPQQVATLYLSMTFALGLVATIIAVPVAAVAGRAYASFTAQLLNFSVDGLPLPDGVVAVQLAVGMLFPVVAAAFPVRRGTRISVGSALRDFGITAPATPATSASVGWTRLFGGVSRPFALSLRNAFRRRQRMVLTLFTLATGGATFIGALNLKASVRGAVALLFENQHFDMSLRLTRGANADSIAAIARAVAGVALAEGWGSARAVPNAADSTLGEGFSIVALAADTRMLGHKVIAGRWLRADDERALVITRQMASHDTTRIVGGTIDATTNGKRITWHIVGIIDDGVSSAAYTTITSFSRLTSMHDVDRVVVAALPSAAKAPLELIQRLRAAFADAGLPVRSSDLVSESRSVMEDHLLMVANFLGVMGQLMIVVGGLALASTMGLAVLERTREIGVLRSIGAKHSSIMTMIQLEGLVIALLGWALAIPLSLPMSVILGNAFGRVMIPVAVTYIPAAAGVGTWLVVVVIVSLVACAWPAWRASRVPTRVALAYA